jgi:hypothetical protein
MMRADKVMAVVLILELRFFMELLRVQGRKSNILAVGDYLRADVPSDTFYADFDPVSSSKGKYGEWLNVEKVFMKTVRLNLEIMATDQKISPGTKTKTPVLFLFFPTFLQGAAIARFCIAGVIASDDCKPPE